jgi:hypothetical protein
MVMLADDVLLALHGGAPLMARGAQRSTCSLILYAPFIRLQPFDDPGLISSHLPSWIHHSMVFL